MNMATSVNTLVHSFYISPATLKRLIRAPDQALHDSPVTVRPSTAPYAWAKDHFIADNTEAGSAAACCWREVVTEPITTPKTHYTGALLLPAGRDTEKLFFMQNWVAVQVTGQNGWTRIGVAATPEQLEIEYGSFEPLILGGRFFRGQYGVFPNIRRTRTTQSPSFAGTGHALLEITSFFFSEPCDTPPRRRRTDPPAPQPAVTEPPLPALVEVTTVNTNPHILFISLCARPPFEFPVRAILRRNPQADFLESQLLDGAALRQLQDRHGSEDPHEFYFRSIFLPAMTAFAASPEIPDPR